MKTTLMLSEIVKQWLIEMDTSVETKRDYQRKIALWFRWLATQDVDPRSPQRAHILHYKQALQQQGKSKYTYFSYVTVVKLFYHFCATQNYAENIGEGIHASIKKREHSKNPLTSDAARRLVESIDTKTLVGKRDKLIVALMLTNGLRTCELERINVGDVVRSGDRLLLRLQRKGHFDKDDVLALPEMVELLYEDYLSSSPKAVGQPLITNHCKGQKSTRLTKQAISRIVKSRLRAIGIDDSRITAHSLRHTCGSLLVESGVDIEMIKDLLGHTNTSTTRIYIEQAQRRHLIDANPGTIIADLILNRPKR